MRRNLWLATAALVTLGACGGEQLTFRGDPGISRLPRPANPQQGAEGDAHAAPQPGSVQDATTEPSAGEVAPPDVVAGPVEPVVSPPPASDPPVALPPSQETPPPVADTCQGINRDVKVLVLDFKSGWFAGDGGEFFHHVVDARCGGKVQIVYAHITKLIVEGNIWNVSEGTTLLPCLAKRTSPHFVTDECRMGSLTAFDAVWVLSGSHADPDDLNSTDPFYASVVSRMVEIRNEKPTSAFFFGAGLGNVHHANLAASTLFPTMGKLFSPNPETSEGILPSPTDYLKFKSKNLLRGTGEMGTFSNATPYLEGLASLFDYAPEDHTDPLAGLKLGKCFSDPIVSGEVTLAARDHCGRATMAYTTAGEHRVAVEGNMARFYGSGGIDYFDRILRYQLEVR